MAKIRLKGKSGQSIETAFAEFIRFCKAKNLAPVTITNYQREFNFNHFYNGELQDISGDAVIQFIEELQKKNIAPTSVNTALRLLRAVLNYCQRVKVINFFIGTGCRLSTLTAVRIGDINWENELIAYFTPRIRRLSTHQCQGNCKQCCKSI